MMCCILPWVTVSLFLLVAGAIFFASGYSETKDGKIPEPGSTDNGEGVGAGMIIVGGVMFVAYIIYLLTAR